ncbi:hypothetical protein P7K49_035780 [Saguinus oedipus]|uniref:Fibronectin type-III domain-containing protein n=1 Tax=Saguinus oedipus TaxID=9490 RepID=A0ABQ9TPA7_SAGOE|nr:hypothetical protein P7K49_035780 [Saguinus oedipus]
MQTDPRGHSGRLGSPTTFRGRGQHIHPPDCLKPSDLFASTQDLHVPSAPRRFRVRQPNLETINLEWDHPEHPNGIMLGYTLKYVAFNGTKVGKQIVENFSPNQTKFTVQRTDPVSRYRFTLSARTQVGSGEAVTEESPAPPNEGAGIESGAQLSFDHCGQTCVPTCPDLLSHLASISFPSRRGIRKRAELMRKSIMNSKNSECSPLEGGRNMVVSAP